MSLWWETRVSVCGADMMLAWQQPLCCHGEKIYISIQKWQIVWAKTFYSSSTLESARTAAAAAAATLHHDIGGETLFDINLDINLHFNYGKSFSNNFPPELHALLSPPVRPPLQPHLSLTVSMLLLCSVLCCHTNTFFNVVFHSLARSHTLPQHLDRGAGKSFLFLTIFAIFQLYRFMFSLPPFSYTPESTIRAGCLLASWGDTQKRYKVE